MHPKTFSLLPEVDEDSLNDFFRGATRAREPIGKRAKRGIVRVKHLFELGFVAGADPLDSRGFEGGSRGHHSLNVLRLLAKPIRIRGGGIECRCRLEQLELAVLC